MAVFIVKTVVGVDVADMMKGSLSNEEFIELCTKVSEYNKLN